MLNFMVVEAIITGSCLKRRVMINATQALAVPGHLSEMTLCLGILSQAMTGIAILLHVL